MQASHAVPGCTGAACSAALILIPLPPHGPLASPQVDSSWRVKVAGKRGRAGWRGGAGMAKPARPHCPGDGGLHAHTAQPMAAMVLSCLFSSRLESNPRRLQPEQDSGGQPTEILTHDGQHEPPLAGALLGTPRCLVRPGARRCRLLLHLAPRLPAPSARCLEPARVAVVALRLPRGSCRCVRLQLAVLSCRMHACPSPAAGARDPRWSPRHPRLRRV